MFLTLFNFLEFALDLPGSLSLKLALTLWNDVFGVPRDQPKKTRCLRTLTHSVSCSVSLQTLKKCWLLGDGRPSQTSDQWMISRR